jgi:hypothetical protein
MAQVIEVPGMGNVEFPDEMSQEDIADAIDNQLKSQSQSNGSNPSTTSPWITYPGAVAQMAGQGIQTAAQHPTLSGAALDAALALAPQSNMAGLRQAQVAAKAPWKLAGQLMDKADAWANSGVETSQNLADRTAITAPEKYEESLRKSYGEDWNSKLTEQQRNHLTQLHRNAGAASERLYPSTTTPTEGIANAEQGINNMVRGGQGAPSVPEAPTTGPVVPQQVPTTPGAYNKPLPPYGQPTYNVPTNNVPNMPPKMATPPAQQAPAPTPGTNPSQIAATQGTSAVEGSNFMKTMQQKFAPMAEAVSPYLNKAGTVLNKAAPYLEGAGKLVAPAMIAKELFYTSPEERAILQKAEAEKRAKGWKPINER